jgi:cytoskeleton protein RodZ
VGSFGERLQREREMRGITLEEIAEATKIGTRSLRALEEQDFDKLPGGIFNKGFVRAYSKYLGIDEDQAVADYVTAVNDAQATGKLSRPEYTTPTNEEPEVEQSEPIRIPWALLIIVALILAVGFSAKSYYSKYGWAKLRRQSTPAAASKGPPVTTQPAPQHTPEPEAPAPTVAATVKPAAAEVPDGFILKIRAKEDAWIQINADGKRVASELMKANSDKVFHADKEIVLVTGNAAGIEISRNDTLLPSLGTDRVKKTVTITAQGMHE